ncbi:hypothetical protein OHT20_17695 [Streptomyces caniferus]|uniref:hypothetical protein n=1 Tax=Streptomyces caniferus TaxID=285557 RepID=UPI002E2D6245|nr:hypothetical protein [Streptomyces caniferus]
MSQLINALPLLACPIAMGAMMWFMMRSGRKAESPQPALERQEAELARLQDEVDRLRAAQRTTPGNAPRTPEPKHL